MDEEMGAQVAGACVCAARSGTASFGNSCKDLGDVLALGELNMAGNEILLDRDAEHELGGPKIAQLEELQ